MKAGYRQAPCCPLTSFNCREIVWTCKKDEPASWELVYLEILEIMDRAPVSLRAQGLSQQLACHGAPFYLYVTVSSAHGKKFPAKLFAISPLASCQLFARRVPSAPWPGHLGRRHGGGQGRGHRGCQAREPRLAADEHERGSRLISQFRVSAQKPRRASCGKTCEIHGVRVCVCVCVCVRGFLRDSLNSFFSGQMCGFGCARLSRLFSAKVS